MTESKDILIIGLGNPILGDDGVGWRVAEEVGKFLATAPKSASLPGVEIDCLSVGGLTLMERLIGYRRAIVIDALALGTEAGRVFSFALEELPDRSAGHLNSAHDTSLLNALRVGRLMGAELPECVHVVGIEASSLYEFSETLTPKAAAAVPLAVQTVIELLTASHRQGRRAGRKASRPRASRKNRKVLISSCA